MNEPTDAPRVGRPPGPHGDTLSKLLPVALSLFIEEGGAALTPTRLFKETGIARATIYRNWPEPTDLIEILLESAADVPSVETSTGDVREDLYQAIDVLLSRFDDRPARAFFAACLEYGRISERVGVAAEAFIDGILTPFRTAIDAGLANGSLGGGQGRDLLLELSGPLLVEQFVMGRTVTRQRARAIVDHFLDHHLVA